MQRQSLKGLSTKRINRIVEDILPLMTQGLTAEEISKRVGIGKSQAWLDMTKAKELLAEDYKESDIEQVRGEAIARQDWIWKTSIEAWNISRAQGAPVAKFLDVAANAAKEKVKLSGAEIDLKFVQQNVSVTMASPEQVADTFQPMDAADFKAFAAAHADAQARAAAAAKQIMPSTSKPIEIDPIDDAELEPAWIDDQVDDAPKNRKVAHPFR